MQHPPRPTRTGRPLTRPAVPRTQPTRRRSPPCLCPIHGRAPPIVRCVRQHRTRRCRVGPTRSRRSSRPWEPWHRSNGTSWRCCSRRPTEPADRYADLRSTTPPMNRWCLPGWASCARAARSSPGTVGDNSSALPGSGARNRYPSRDVQKTSREGYALLVAM